MLIKRVDSTISTYKLQESKDFYIKHFGFRLVFESDWYVELLPQHLDTAGISFVLAQREDGEFFSGRGLILSFEVDDVDKEYERLKAENLDICQELQDKPWGERSFVVDDPNGVHVYVYKSIPPTPEYQEIYQAFKK